METVMTKKKFANSIVDKFCDNMGLDRSSMTPEAWNTYVGGGNLTLSICLEYLNLLDNNGLHWTAFREGVHGINPESFEVITIRNYIESLPDNEVPEIEVLRLKAENNSLDSIIKLFKQYKIDTYMFNIDSRLILDHVHHKAYMKDV